MQVAQLKASFKKKDIRHEVEMKQHKLEINFRDNLRETIRDQKAKIDQLQFEK
jgi:hypothetical protein